MSFLGGILGDAIKPITDIVKETVKDKDKALQLEADIQRVVIDAEDKAEQRIHEQMLAQIDVNKTEAASSNMFVAGWRPAVGWVGVTGMAYSFIINPVISWVARVAFEYEGSFPSLETEAILFFMAGMLGFGGLRTWEKISGVSTKEPEPSPPASEASQGQTGIKLDPDTIKRITTPPKEVPWSR